jgi:Alpha amylase, C-terminal all-beta domain
MKELVWLRRRQLALCSERINVFHVHEDNRTIAFQRWIEGVGRDVVVICSLNELTFWSYDIGFPQPSRWLEVFNSDVYENWVNPWTAGNHGSIFAGGPGTHTLKMCRALQKGLTPRAQLAYHTPILVRARSMGTAGATEGPARQLWPATLASPPPRGVGSWRASL